MSILETNLIHSISSKQISISNVGKLVIGNTYTHIYYIYKYLANIRYFIIFVAVPSLLVWGIVCPMQLFHFFREKKEKIFEKEYIEAYGFLLRGYTKKSISNEFIIFYRKLILIMIAIYADFSSRT